MSEIKKSYYAIIPASVRYDTDLTPNAKLLYGEITALCNEKGYCWAGNQYFADLYGVSKVSISKWVNQLVEKGYLNSEIKYREGTKEILNRYLRIVNDPIKEKLSTPIKEKFKDNNTLLNNTFNNTYEDTKSESAPYEKIKDMYNNTCTSLSNVRSLSDTRKKHIRARWQQFNCEIATFKEIFELVESSKFLTGNNDRKWKADLDWLIKNDTNMLKVLEGKYSDGGGGPGTDNADDPYAGIGISFEDLQNL